MEERKSRFQGSSIVESSFNCLPKTQPAECVCVAIEMVYAKPASYAAWFTCVRHSGILTPNCPAVDLSLHQMGNITADAVFIWTSPFRWVMASLLLKVELDLKYRCKIWFHLMVFPGKKGMGVLEAPNYVCNFKKMKIVLLGCPFLCRSWATCFT